MIAVPLERFRPLARRDVSPNPLHAHRDSILEEQTRADFQRRTALVLGEQRHLKSDLGGATKFLADHLLCQLAGFRGEELPDAHAQGLFAAVARNPLGSLVDGGQPAFQVVGIDQIGGVLEKLPVVVLRRQMWFFVHRESPRNVALLYNNYNRRGSL